MADTKKFYWLKLKRDFFKRHDVRIIEEMPNGKDYILFYLKLLLESIDHEGSLRFSDTIPYNEQMLSVVTNTNVDIVRAAMKLFIDLGMMAVFDDQTIYMNEVNKLIGCETEWAKKKREYRERTLSSSCPPLVPSVSDKSKSKSESIEIDKEKKENIKEKTHQTKKGFVPPTFEEVLEYAKSRGREDLAQKFFDYFEAGDWIDSKGNKVRNWKQKFITWESKNTYNEKGANNEEYGRGTTGDSQAEPPVLYGENYL